MTDAVVYDMRTTNEREDRFQRFQQITKSTTCVLSTPPHAPTPAASTISSRDFVR